MTLTIKNDITTLHHMHDYNVGTIAKVSCRSKYFWPMALIRQVWIATYNNFVRINNHFLISGNAWILTRARNPQSSVLDKAYEVADKNRISRTFFMTTNQQDCPEEWYKIILQYFLHLIKQIYVSIFMTLMLMKLDTKIIEAFMRYLFMIHQRSK